MARAGPRKVHRYSLEFKRQAVRLSQLEGVQVQAVADALAIHPFMLSKWRKEAREGRLRGRVSVPAAVRTPRAREMKRYQALRRAHALLQEEHALLKKAIRFCSARKPTSSPSSTRSGRRVGWRGCAGAMGSRARGTTRGAVGP
jgi:transposase